MCDATTTRARDVRDGARPGGLLAPGRPARKLRRRPAAPGSALDGRRVDRSPDGLAAARRLARAGARSRSSGRGSRAGLPRAGGDHDGADPVRAELVDRSRARPSTIARIRAESPSGSRSRGRRPTRDVPSSARARGEGRRRADRRGAALGILGAGSGVIAPEPSPGPRRSRSASSRSISCTAGSSRSSPATTRRSRSDCAWPWRGFAPSMPTWWGSRRRRRAGTAGTCRPPGGGPRIPLRLRPCGDPAVRERAHARGGGVGARLHRRPRAPEPVPDHALAGLRAAALRAAVRRARARLRGARDPRPVGSPPSRPTRPGTPARRARSPTSSGRTRGRCPAVVMGDFNAPRTSPAVRLLTHDAGFVDAFALANPGAPGFTDGQDVEVARPTASQRIDYVFLAPGQRSAGRVVGSRVVLDEPARTGRGPLALGSLRRAGGDRPRRAAPSRVGTAGLARDLGRGGVGDHGRARAEEPGPRGCGPARSIRAERARQPAGHHAAEVDPVGARERAPATTARRPGPPAPRRVDRAPGRGAAAPRPARTRARSARGAPPGAARRGGSSRPRGRSAGRRGGSAACSSRARAGGPACRPRCGSRSRTGARRARGARGASRTATAAWCRATASRRRAGARERGQVARQREPAARARPRPRSATTSPRLDAVARSARAPDARPDAREGEVACAGRSRSRAPIACSERSHVPARNASRDGGSSAGQRGQDALDQVVALLEVGARVHGERARHPQVVERVLAPASSSTSRRAPAGRAVLEVGAAERARGRGWPPSTRSSVRRCRRSHDDQPVCRTW